VAAAIFAGDGQALIASDDSGAVSTLDVESGRVIGAPLSVGNQVADSLDLSPDGRLLAAASFDGSVFVWDRQTGTVFGTPLRADTSPVGDVVFSPDGRALVTAHVRSAVVWDLSGGHVLGAPLGGPRDVTTNVAFSSDGRWLVAGLLDGGTVVHDARTRRVARRIDGDAVVSALAVHPDSTIVAIGTIDGRVRLVDRETGAAAGSPLDVGTGAIWQAAFSPDGRLLAVAVDPNGAGEKFFAQQRQGEIQLWDVESRRRVGRAIVPGAGSVFSVAFSPDGALLATGSGGRLDLWDVASQDRRGVPTRVADDGVLSVAFDPSGRLVAAGGAIGPVRVWRVEDRRPAFPPLSGHTGYVTGTAFDPVGSLLATTSLFGGTRLWDPATGLGYGDELMSPRPESLEPTVDLAALPLRNAFSPDGTLLATAGVDAYAMLWDVDPAVWRRRACDVAGRNLSLEEWRLYLPSDTPYRATCPESPGG
jgi:WD40 repeat protein